VTDPTHVATLARAVLAGDYDACGVLADYLEERGDPRGVLLRKRWKRWQKERDGAEARGEAAVRDEDGSWGEVVGLYRSAGTPDAYISHAVTSRLRDAADLSLCRYVARRFPESRHRP
jgi:hypothetical protein